ncbi:hypothetical protein XENOCAPTIV_011928 [Xenoophorus captivus]|uniref:Uncharacterized protein n=1 Tax=Xenoophorus captivus TaxID=1517983 RepID=A0ABV0RUJ8_9TELE
MPQNLLMLPVHTGSNPQYSKGTYIPVFPTKARQSYWGGRITQTNDNVITMGITPAASCIVGKYHLYIAVQTPFGIRRTKRENSRDLYILFNPWAADQTSLQVLEAGRLWMQHHKKPATVNSDVVFYSRKNDGTMEPVKVNQTHVGRMVLTKAAGSEGQERTVLEKAEEFGCKREKSTPPVADVDVVLPTLEISVGDDFEFSVEFVNCSDQKRTVDAYISGSVVYYTGVSGKEFLLKTPTVTIQAQKSVKELMTVESRNYMDHLVEQANLHFIVTGKIRETGRIVTAMKVITLHNPKLTVELTGSSKVNEEMIATVQFTNPFSINLERVYLRMEGPGVMEPKSRYYR